VSAVPQQAAARAAEPVVYVGFWARFGASLIDSVLVLALMAPLMHMFYGDIDDWSNAHGFTAFTINYVLPAVAVIAFWFTRGATPGKMVLSAVIVDAQTLETPSHGQLIARYFSYYVSLIPLCLGFLWIAFDKRKQGWHDKIAGTVVIRKPR
jgi:uncharacterized RDD family membrane protein YckC